MTKSTPSDPRAPDAAGLTDGALRRDGAAEPDGGRSTFVARLRRSAILALAALMVLAGFFLGGLYEFADRILAMTTPSPLVADGIVVLTGGAERISGAVELLAAGKARRLLISGVHPGTSASRLAQRVDAPPELMTCCIDLDRRAANTVGNAAETAKWVRKHGFLSLIVVTSAYHMPRSMLEFGAAMPGIRLIPFPVVRETLGLERWQDNRATLILVVEEYAKYLAARLRLMAGNFGGLAGYLAGIDL